MPDGRHIDEVRIVKREDGVESMGLTMSHGKRM